MPSMQVVVDSLLTHYETMGEGKLVLLLHGWGDTAAGLRGLQAALAKKNYRVVALDLPGFGGTQAPTTVWGLADYAQFAAHFLQKIKAGELWAVAGHSNGGAIAIRSLANGALKAERLVLIASAGIRGTHKGRVGAAFVAAKLGKVLASPLPGPAKKALRRKLYQTAGSDMLVAEHLQETFKKVVGDDVRADAAKLTLPSLLIYGEQDTATPVAFGEQFHELIAGSTLEILPGAGHFVHLDRPQDVVRAVQEFLR